MATHLRRALDFIEAAESARTIDELERLMHGALAPFGVSAFSLIGLSTRAGTKARAPIALGNGCDPEWKAQYEAERLYNSDAVIHYALRLSNSFSWTDVERRPMPENARAMFSACRDALGVDGAFIVPSYDAQGFAGLAALFHEQHAIEEDAKKPLRMIAHYASERAKEIRGVAITDPAWEICPLTQRQREMVAFSAMGKSDWDVSKLIGRSEKTINHHFERAKKTLGVKTRAQAVAIAVHRGWVAP